MELIGPAREELSYLADAVMPAQFYPTRRGSASVEPIVRLMGGILADAVRCFQRNFDARTQTRRQEFREAKFWIFYDKGEGPFSFRGRVRCSGNRSASLEAFDYSLGEK